MPQSKTNKKAGKRSAESPPAWYPRRQKFRKRLTMGGQQKEFFFDHPNTAKGQAAAAHDWLTKLGELRHAEAVARCVKQHLEEANRPDAHPDWRDTMRQIARDMQQGWSYDEAQQRAVTAMAMRGRIRDGKFAEAATLGDQLEPRQLEGKPMSDLLEEYRAATQRKFDANEIGRKRNGDVRRWTKRETETDFGQAIVPEEEPDLGRLISDYRNRCLDEMKNEEYRESAFDDRMKECRQFILWGCSEYKLPREPRNLKAAFKKFNKRADGAKMIPLDQLKKIWDCADGQMKTIIAMSLNCGFYAVDYAHITPAMVKDGRLNFKRHKTRKQANGGRGVSVSYLLWDVTSRLIDQHGNKTSEYLITDEFGQPRYIETENSRDDKIYRAFKELCERAGVTGYTFSNVRDTGTTLIEEIDSTFSDTYGAHMDQRIAAFYIDGSSLDKSRLYKNFDQAIVQLGQRLEDVLV